MKQTLILFFIFILTSCNSKRFDDLRLKSERLYQENNCEQALVTINKVIRFDKNNPIAYNDRSSYYACLNQIDLAFKDINKAIQIDNNYSKAYVNRANLYNRIKEYDKSLADLRMAYENEYDLQRTLKYLILVSKAASKYSEALDYCNEYIDSFSDSTIYLKRAQIYFELKNYKKSYEDLDIYTEYDSTDSEILILLGKIKNKENKHEDAIALYKKVLIQNNKNGDVFYNLGYSYFEINSFDTALYYTKLALELDTTNLIYYQLGRIEEFRENYKMAIDYLTKAIRIDTLDAKSYFVRGMNFGLIEKYQELYYDLQKAFFLGYSDEKYNINWWEEKKIYLKKTYDIEIN